MTLAIARVERRGSIWILDSSAAINFKTLPIDRQWEFGDILLDLIGAGELLFPSQVHRELTDPQLIRHPDMPGAWVARAWRLMKPHPAPKDTTVREVLRAHPDLIDVNAQHDQADPYVVALAVELSRAGDPVRVVADEGETRALQAACRTFGIDVEDLSQFAQAFISRA